MFIVGRDFRDDSRRKMGTFEQIQNRVYWTVAILLVFSYVEANTGCSRGGFGACFAGFPARMLLLSDAGGLRPFAWGLWGVNLAIGIVAFLTLVWLCWGDNRLRWVQYSTGASFAAAFAWANPIMMRLKVADQQRMPGFIDASPVDAGFPFVFLSVAQGLKLPYVFVNALLGLVCLEAIYRVFEAVQHNSQPKPNAFRRWAAIWVPLFCYIWITQHYGRASAYWHRFGFAYFHTDEGLEKLHWWVTGTDILIGALLVALLLAITTNKRANVMIFVTGYAWANPESWPRWYEWLGMGGNFPIGFPFPFYHRSSDFTDLLGILTANVAIGLGMAYFIHRRSEAQNAE